MTSKGAIPKGARSKVWRHFENVVLANDDQHVLCILCKQNNNGKKKNILYKKNTGRCSNHQKWDHGGIREKALISQIPEIPEDSENISGMDRVLEKKSGSGRVSGTRWALPIMYTI